MFAILLSLAIRFAFSAFILAFASIWLALIAVILALDATFVVRLPFALFAVLAALALFPAVSQAIAIVPTTNIAERAKVFFKKTLSLLPFSKINYDIQSNCLLNNYVLNDFFRTKDNINTSVTIVNLKNTKKGFLNKFSQLFLVVFAENLS